MENVDDITPERMAKYLSPRQAAQDLARAFLVKTADPEGTAYIDRLVKDNPAAGWFRYCHNAIARQAPDRMTGEE